MMGILTLEFEMSAQGEVMWKSAEFRKCETLRGMVTKKACKMNNEQVLHKKENWDNTWEILKRK